MAEQFACFEALLSRGNVFSAPKMSVTPVSAHQVISDTPFLDPNTARPTGLVRLPAGSEDAKGSESKHEKKKSHKSKHKFDKKSCRHSDKLSDKSTDRHFDTSDSHASTSTTPAGYKDIPDPGIKSVPPQNHLSQSTVYSSGQLAKDSPATGPAQLQPQARSAHPTYGPTDPEDYPLLSTCSDLPDDPEDSEHYSYSEPDKGELSDNGDKQEVTEDMNYRETDRSVRSFMGWNHILVFETSVNRTKATTPGRVKCLSVLPMCQSQCHQTIGYAKSCRDSVPLWQRAIPPEVKIPAALKRDQFIKMPKSQSRWYQMHTIKPDTPHCPDKSVFSWRNTEAKMNSQFPRITNLFLVPLPKSALADGKGTLRRAVTL